MQGPQHRHPVPASCPTPTCFLTWIPMSHVPKSPGMPPQLFGGPETVTSRPRVSSSRREASMAEGPRGQTTRGLEGQGQHLKCGAGGLQGQIQS